VTLAPLHAGPIANWIAHNTLPGGIGDFGSERFKTENAPYEH
jgi:hypothetical protein